MEAILILIVLIFSIIVHEVAHGYAAYTLGDPTAKLAGRLTLNPVPHIDPMGSIFLPALLVFTHSPIFFGWAKPVPYNPYNLRNQRWGEAFVAIAGVATNLFLAVIFAGFVRLASAGLIPETAGAFAGTVVFVNLFLALFNLIPFPPLDGFTFLRGILPFQYARHLVEIEHKVQSSGFVTLILFLLVFSYFFAPPFFNFVFWVAGLLMGV